MVKPVDLNLFICLNHGVQACDICAPGLRYLVKNDNNKVSEVDFLDHMLARRRQLIGEVKMTEDILVGHGRLKPTSRLTK